MLFTSLHWAIFLVVAFAAYHIAPIPSRRWVMLIASIYFYASWSAPHLTLIGAQLLVDWTCGYLLSKTDDPLRRKRYLITSIAANCSALCVFKYYGFFVETASFFGFKLPLVNLTLPLAISFYTFESMSYTIDIYRRQLEPVKSPLHLALFITWFPHLIAGPIIRPSEFVPQLAKVSSITRKRFFSGLMLMAIGYAKKLLGADWLGAIADPIFAHPNQYTSLELLVGMYAYAFQIYLDFSAYTDIARGASRWFGVNLPENFNAPYLSTSITDFWRRWHMTLSHWLRDYLYIFSLGGNQHGKFRTYLNLLITMLLGGLWHGASWTFVAWGGLHGLFLAVERVLGVKTQSNAIGMKLWFQRIFTFHLVCVAWILFRARTFGLALKFLSGLAEGSFRITKAHLLPALGALAIIVGYWLVAPLRTWLVAFIPKPNWVQQGAFATALGLFLFGLMIVGASSNAFIYFQF